MDPQGDGKADGPPPTTTSAAAADSKPARVGPVLPPRPAKRSASGGTPGQAPTSNGNTTALGAPSSSTQQPSIALNGDHQSGSGAGVQPPTEGSRQQESSATEVPRVKGKRGQAGGAGGGGGGSGFMPALPPRQAAPAAGPVLDPDEPAELQQVRTRIHEVRVSLIRAAQRLGYDAENTLVRQVLYRLALAEKLRAPWRRSTKRPDPNAAAVREAARLEAAGAAADGGAAGQSSQQPGLQPLGFCVRMMLVGLAGTGKTQLIQALLGDSKQRQQKGNKSSQPADVQGEQWPTWPVVDPIQGATRKPCVHKGESCGIPLEIMDTPGLLAAAAGTAHNQAALQQIRRAFKSFKPDLVLYVDRLDAGGAARWGGELPALQGLSNALGPGTWLNTIVALTHAGASPPAGPKGPVPWDQWASQRSHALQQVIRTASGDNRLMNPTAFVESHPATKATWGRDAAGIPLLYNGMAWRPHLLLMVVSAKLLADTENMLQMQDGESGGAAGASAAAQQMLINQMMGGAPRTLPLPYLVTQACQFSQPLQYPDHDQVMAVRTMEVAAAAATDARQRKLLVRQAKGMRLQIKQAIRSKERMSRSFKMATLAGTKITPVPPPLATKRPPSAHPPCTHRYRVPEASGGWVVRPSVEPHGMDTGDGIEGLQMEQYTVAGRNKKKVWARLRQLRGAQPAQPAGSTSTGQEAAAGESTPGGVAQAGAAAAQGATPVHGTDSPGRSSATLSSAATASGSSQASQPLAGQAQEAAIPAAKAGQMGREEEEKDEDELRLGGIPVHHYLSAQATKGQLMLQGRSETTLYHDPLGTTTTALSADVQASTSGGAPLDALLTLRADTRRKQVPLLPGGDSSRATAGLMLTRLAEGGRLDRGPVALGGRLQHSFKSILGGGMPKRKPQRKSKGGLSLAAPPPMPRKAVPIEVAAAMAVMAAPWGSTSHATAASLAALGGGPPASLDPEMCLGGSLEVTAEAQQLLNTRRSAPCTLGANVVSYKGEIMAGLAMALQLYGRHKDTCGVRVQLGNKGKAGVNLKVRSGPKWWMGLVAMAVPLTSLLLEALGLVA